MLWRKIEREKMSVGKQVNLKSSCLSSVIQAAYHEAVFHLISNYSLQPVVLVNVRSGRLKTPH